MDKKTTKGYNRTEKISWEALTMSNDRQYFPEAENDKHNVANVLYNPEIDKISPDTKIADLLNLEESPIDEPAVEVEEVTQPAVPAAEDELSEDLHDEALLEEAATVQEEKPSKERYRPSISKIKKPRFNSQREAQEQLPEEAPMLDEVVEAAKPAEESNLLKHHPLKNEDKVDVADTMQQPLSDEEKQEAEQSLSICKELHELQNHLETANSPLFHKDEVLVNREATLTLVRALTAICAVDSSYFDSASEDALVDCLVGTDNKQTYKPLAKARDRARKIIKDAERQGNQIIKDARILAAQVLSETNTEIQEKIAMAEKEVNERLETAKVESSKRLQEGLDELSRYKQQSREILTASLAKAEEDFEGYWVRADNTVINALNTADSVLGKAADIYKKELEFIHEDKEEIERILEQLRLSRPFY